MKKTCEALCLLLLLALARPVRGDAPSVTYSRDIAPIIYEHCGRCHRPGESAPFSLLSYADVSKRSRQIAQVTRNRYMPPWLPEPGYGRFAGQRRLSDDQIRTIGRWVEQGAVEGDPSDLPRMPDWPSGWLLGQPDLVVRMAEPYTLRADGPDVFRNFVMPIPISRARYVRAVELRPGDKRVVHHALMMVDRTGTARRRDAEETGPGFGGMDVAGAEPPGGRLIGWTPGKYIEADPEETSWRLRRGTDVVLQLHMLPGGKPHTIQAAVGFHFTDKPPTRRPYFVMIRNDRIDIPAGAKDYRIEEQFRLPVAAEVLSVQPHAHYLGKQMKVFATLPDGSNRWLLYIRDWDFNWQDDYRYIDPVPLPAGTVVTMQFTYDNSGENPRNPSDPPRRVVFGLQSSDEMATLGLQVQPGSDDDLRTLDLALSREYLRKDSDNALAHMKLGALLAAEDPDQAIWHYRQALRQNPGWADVYYNMGALFDSRGAHDEAVEHYQRAIEIDPQRASTHLNLANTFKRMKRVDDALRHYARVLQIDPAHARARNNMALALRSQGRVEQAIIHFREVIRIDPQHAPAQYNLAATLLSQGRIDDAVAHYRSAHEIAPDRPSVLSGLGAALAARGEIEEARTHLARALELVTAAANEEAARAIRAQLEMLD